MTWRVWSSIDSGYGDAFDVPVKGICPVTNTQPSASTA